jgi:hypothetical protein
MTLGNLQQGINIRMRKMNSTTIAADGRSATFGGGILGIEVRDSLWAAGKETGISTFGQKGTWKEKLTISSYRSM